MTNRRNITLSLGGELIGLVDNHVSDSLGLYAHRTDFIRAAIREKLQRETEVTE